LVKKCRSRFKRERSVSFLPSCVWTEAQSSYPWCHYKASSEPEVIKVLGNDLYVDDLATGTDSEDEAVSLFKSAKRVMSNGGFNLRKWNCNSSQVRKVISKVKGSNSPRNFEGRSTERGSSLARTSE
jgi:hypothetical protein